MDPISQATLGVVAAQSASDPRRLRAAAFLGCVAGLAPDIDVFISSPTDPLLFLEFHRQFTHSLVFIPFGALICSAMFYLAVRQYLSFKETFWFCLLGYATHGLLDACTTYGTQLFWPFSTYRVAWNNVSVIDPLLTVPALILMIAAIVKVRVNYARMAFAWTILICYWVSYKKSGRNSPRWNGSGPAGTIPSAWRPNPALPICSCGRSCTSRMGCTTSTPFG
ncbi:MAG: hypothetical protein ETSY2_02580 [Candidatus Entotheonella gemina]|uniref:Metal-dependent hydrolase n=1 Tax=Candidatus Entotheonella gemina TaxID=1429439 RepID=W4MG68_9BACT|nr:MAG: hypothetical protein ETSY2_02580 [Candidatus Entotheonella gemina]